MQVSGSAGLSGKVVANPIGFPVSSSANKGLTKTFTILTAAGRIRQTHNAITVDNTAAVIYSLLYPNFNTLQLKAVIDFTGAAPPPPSTPTSKATGGLPTNQTTVGTNLNAVVGSGSTLGFLNPLAAIPTQAGLGAALNQLMPSGDGGNASSTMTTSTTFAQQLLSSRVNGDTADNDCFIREGQCLWAHANARHLDNDGGGSAGHIGYNETASFFSAGGQLNLGGDWRIGGGFGFEQSNIDTKSAASADTDRLQLGGVIKYNPGPWLFAAAL